MPDIILDDSVATLVGTWGTAADNRLWFGGCSVSNTTTNTATYPFTGLTPGQTYGVYVTWLEGVNRTTVAQCTVKGAGGATLGSATYNQQIAPSGVIRNDTARDVTFQLMATITADGTTGSVVIGFPTESAGFGLVADAVMVAVLVIPPTVTLGAAAGPALASLGLLTTAPPRTATLAALAQPATISMSIHTLIGDLVIGGFYTVPAPRGGGGGGGGGRSR